MPTKIKQHYNHNICTVLLFQENSKLKFLNPYSVVVSISQFLLAYFKDCLKNNKMFTSLTMIFSLCFVNIFLNFIFVNFCIGYEIYNSRFILFYIDIKLFQHPFVEKTTNYFFIKLPLYPFQKSIGHICIHPFLGSLFYSVDQCVYPLSNTLWS